MQAPRGAPRGAPRRGPRPASGAIVHTHRHCTCFRRNKDCCSLLNNNPYGLPAAACQHPSAAAPRWPAHAPPPTPAFAPASPAPGSASLACLGSGRNNEQQLPYDQTVSFVWRRSDSEQLGHWLGAARRPQSDCGPKSGTGPGRGPGGQCFQVTDSDAVINLCGPPDILLRRRVATSYRAFPIALPLSAVQW